MLFVFVIGLVLRWVGFIIGVRFGGSNKGTGSVWGSVSLTISLKETPTGGEFKGKPYLGFGFWF